MVFGANKGYRNDTPPYLLSDEGYPLISWIMMPFKILKTHTIL